MFTPHIHHFVLGLQTLPAAVAYRGGRGDFGVFNPPEIPKVLQNRAKLNPIVKTVKNC